MSQKNTEELSLPRGLINRTGSATGRGARLPSLRSPRDLTLGGIQKKTFTPNIPARRERKDGAGSSTSVSQGKKDSTKGQNFRPSGRGRGKLDVIQSQSIFSQGPADRLNKPKGSWGASVESDQKPTRHVVKREPKPKFHSSDNQKLSDLLRDDFVDDKSFREEGVYPIQLPINKMAMKKEDQQVALVKEEPMSPEPKIKSLKSKVDVELTTSTVRESRELTSEELFCSLSKSGEERLMFIQFPDCLPCLHSCGEESDSTKESSSTTQVDNSSKKTPSGNLEEMPEGYVGKLIVRKSGKTQLQLGKLLMNIDLGANCAFLQDLVSIDTSSKEMTVLGHMDNRLVCSPDFISLLSSS